MPLPAGWSVTAAYRGPSARGAKANKFDVGRRLPVEPQLQYQVLDFRTTDCHLCRLADFPQSVVYTQEAAAEAAAEEEELLLACTRAHAAGPAAVR